MGTTTPPRFHGLDLEIFNPEQLVSKMGLRSPATIPRTPTFIRQVALDTTVPSSLDTLQAFLAAADLELDRASTMCGAETLAHEWGLVPLRGLSRLVDRGHPLLPKGYELAARVDRIEPRDRAEHGEDPIEARVELASQVRGYQFGAAGDYKLMDMKTEQFMYGVRAAEPAAPPGTWLVDIEPLLWKN